MSETGLPARDVWALLGRSRLLGSEALQSLQQRWQSVAISPGSGRDLLAWLTQNQHLTEYQARLVGEGKVDNFYLNEYKILARIGKGRMAGVFKGQHPQGQLLAIKVLPPSRAREPETLARFQREARLAMQLSHHSVVRTLDYGQCRDLHFLVMEYLEGETLMDTLGKRDRLLPRETARLGFLMALGLQHIHEKGMVHRDLNPGNLMLSPQPAPYEQTTRSMIKILDIGLGRNLFDPDAREAPDDLTSEGTMLGTPDYLAPEQARDPRKADIRSDLYSLGCILYHALAGEPPFADINMVRQLLRHATQPPRPLAELNSQVSADLEGIVARLMAKDPAQRYPTPGAAAEALKGFLASPGP